MSAGNRSPLGFGSILLFHLSVLAGGVFIQNAYQHMPDAVLVILGIGAVLGIWAAWMWRSFLWDVFRNFKSAGILITLLVLSCVLGTFLIQDLDLRRDGTFDKAYPPPVTLDRVAAVVGSETGVPPRQIRAGSGPRLERARDLAFYLSDRLLSIEPSQLGAYFGGLDSAAVTSALERIGEQVAKSEDAAAEIETKIDAKYDEIDSVWDRVNVKDSTAPERAKALDPLLGELKGLQAQQSRTLGRVLRRLENELALPSFDASKRSGNQPTRFAVAESHGWLWIAPNRERKMLTKIKTQLSEVEKAQVELRREAFGDRAANTFGKAVVRGKERDVNNMTTSNFAREHYRGLYWFYSLCNQLRLFDIFEALWFYILLGLIAVNVIVGTFARAPWDARSFGVVVTHSGILIILAGALLDRLVAKEGYIHYVYGKPDQQVSSKIYDQKNKVYHHLPFSVELERFATEYYHELLVRRFDWSRRDDGSAWAAGHEGHQHRGSPFNAVNTYPIRVGVPMTFEKGEISVTFTKYKPRVFIETEVADDPSQGFSPAAQMAIYRDPAGEGKNLLRGRTRTWLFAMDKEKRVWDAGDFRFEYVWAKDAAEYEQLARQAPVPDNGTLVLRSGKEQVRIKVALGDTTRIQLGERMLEIEFASIRSSLSDAGNVNIGRRKQRGEAPVLFVKVNGRMVPVPRNDTEFTSDFNLLQGVEFRFDWPDPKDKGVFSIYRIIEAEGKPRAMVQADYSGQGSVATLRDGVTVALKGKLEGYFFASPHGLRHARERRAIREVSDKDFLTQGGGERDHLLAAWGHIVIDSKKWGKVERDVTPLDGPIPYAKDKNGQPLYWFELFKSSMALDWFSVLTAVDHDGNRKKSHIVQVNSPLRYQGYRFFQATAGTTDGGLSVSGISVTYNPGVNFMYLGYYILTLGVCYIFFLRPIMDRDRRRGGILFGFTGRLDRSKFWRSGNLVIHGIDLAAVILSLLLGVGTLWFFILFWWIPSLWPRLALHVKRCHDVNRSGWFLLVPFLSLFECWAMRSYPETNRWDRSGVEETRAKGTISKER